MARGARPGADARPGLALQQAKTRKLRTHPELQPGGHGRCRLVVFGLEVGGRFDSQALALLRRLARARARDRAPWAREGAGAALTRRWTALAALAAFRAHARSLLELPVRPCDASDSAELPLGELLATPPSWCRLGQKPCCRRKKGCEKKNQESLTLVA